MIYDIQDLAPPHVQGKPSQYPVTTNDAHHDGDPFTRFTGLISIIAEDASPGYETLICKLGLIHAGTLSSRIGTACEVAVTKFVNHHSLENI